MGFRRETIETSLKDTQTSFRFMTDELGVRLEIEAIRPGIVKQAINYSMSYAQFEALGAAYHDITGDTLQTGEWYGDK